MHRRPAASPPIRWRRAEVGTLMFPIAQRFVERVMLDLRRRDLRGAAGSPCGRLRIVAGPGGAAALAATDLGRYRPAGERA
jgi:threonine dehydratase